MGATKLKRTLIISTLLFSSLLSRADYRPLQLYEMILKAEKIVYGTIVKLDSNYFTLNVEGSLTSDSGTLKIVRFHDWPCASRWKNYEVGQRLFLFLRTWNGELVSMSGGNEGELPVFKNNVFIDGLSLPQPLLKDMSQLPQGILLRASPVTFDASLQFPYGAKYYGYKVAFNKFLEAVHNIRSCFDFVYGNNKERTNWKINCGTTEIEQKRESSKLFDWVYHEATETNER